MDDDYLFRLDPLPPEDSAQRKARAVLEYDGPKLYSPADLKKLAEEDVELYFPTGFPTFDQKFRGIPNGRVTLVAAGSSQGKSAFALELAFRVAARKEGHVLYFSAELGPREVAHRAKRRGWNFDLDAHLRVVEDPAPTTKSMRQVFEHIALLVEQRPSMVIFDYLDYSGEDVEHKPLRLEQAIKGCHMLAVKYWCPFVVIQQLGDEMEKAMRPPQLSDLSWSKFSRRGSSMVILLWHRYTQALNSQWKENFPEDWELQAFVRKNTHGRLGDLTFHFDLPTGKICDPSESPMLS